MAVAKWVEWTRLRATHYNLIVGVIASSRVGTGGEKTHGRERGTTTRQRLGATQWGGGRWPWQVGDRVGHAWHGPKRERLDQFRPKSVGDSESEIGFNLFL